MTLPVRIPPGGYQKRPLIFLQRPAQSFNRFQNLQGSSLWSWVEANAICDWEHIGDMKTLESSGFPTQRPLLQSSSVVNAESNQANPGIHSAAGLTLLHTLFDDGISLGHSHEACAKTQESQNSTVLLTLQSLQVSCKSIFPGYICICAVFNGEYTRWLRFKKGIYFVRDTSKNTKTMPPLKIWSSAWWTWSSQHTHASAMMKQASRVSEFLLLSQVKCKRMIDNDQELS